MKLTMKSLFAVLFAAAVLFTSCGDDDDPTFTVDVTSSIDETMYTLGGTLEFQYSTDNGATFSSDVPTNLKKNSTLIVKVNNGTLDLSDDDFDFDWSNSTPAPADSEVDQATFTIDGNVIINVKISDLWSLITSRRDTGLFQELNKTTGATDDLFTFSFNGGDLTGVRAFTYHFNQESYYASTNTNEGGDLYKIDPATRIATKINDNDGAVGAVWDAVVNWAVAADDSLVSIGDFNADGNGIVKFGVDGGQSSKIAQADICCGLGMIYANSKFTLANDPNNGEIDIDELELDGTLTDVTEISTLNSFPSDISGDWLPVRNMAQDMDGTIYALMFNDDTDETYFITIDITGETATYIATLTAVRSEAYHSLTFVPSYLF